MAFRDLHFAPIAAPESNILDKHQSLDLAENRDVGVIFFKLFPDVSFCAI